METDRASETNFWYTHIYIYVYVYFFTHPFRFLEFQKDLNLSRDATRYENEIIHFPGFFHFFTRPMTCN